MMPESLKKASLQDRIDTPAEAKLFCNVGSVDGIELDIVLRNIALQGAGQMLIELQRHPRSS